MMRPKADAEINVTVEHVMKTVKIALLICIATALAGCNSGPNQPTVKMAPQLTAAKRYHLRGKIVSIDKPAKMANVDSEAIPDFMSAMTMPYQIKPEGELEKLRAGDTITADVVLENDNYWLENIVVTGHAPPPASK
jgi:Cu/Ag efflux protein CusF